MIQLDRLTVRCGGFSLCDVSLRLAAGDYAVLMGPSGAGKTTLLEAVAGLRRIDRGRVLLDGVDATRLPPAARGVGFVPQDTALFTTMSVRDNVGYALRLRGESRSSIDRRVVAVAELLGIGGLLDRSPRGLSGGEARRVAIGRAVAAPTRVVLLDEPLNGLDDATREEVYRALERARAATRCAVIHVSHDARDAERLASHTLVLQGGRLVGGDQPNSVAPLKRFAAADRSGGSRPAPAPTARS